MAGVQVGGPQPTCFTDYRTGQKSGNCSSSPTPAAASPSSPSATPSSGAAPSSGSFSFTPAATSYTPPAYEPPAPPTITAPGPTTPTPQQQQPQSMVSLGNQMQQPLDAINEDAMPSLRDNLGRRTPPSMSALLAQMARVY